MCGAPRRPREQLLGRWCASMDDAWSGSRGASFTEHSLAPKNRSGTEVGTPYLQAPGPRPFFRGSSRGVMAATRCAARGTRRDLRARGHVRLPERG